MELLDQQLGEITKAKGVGLLRSDVNSGHQTFHAASSPA